jgi:hypothetical protein
MMLRGLAMALVALPLAAASAQPPGWQEAVAELRAERERAVTCAARARTLDAATADGLAFRYGLAKAEVDAVIAGLDVTLARRRAPADLPSLQARMEQGAALRQAFCAAVLDRAPLTPGERSVLPNLLDAFAKPLADGVAGLWGWWREDDALRRDTIRAQLEATRWPDFSAVSPSR